MLSTFFIFSCFLSFALNLILYPWHIRFENVPGLSVLSWLTVASFAYGLNAAAFPSDSLLAAKPYCDIVTKVLMGAQMGVSMSMTCYMFQFGDWLCRPEHRNLKTKMLEHRTGFHVVLCIVAPILYIALHVVAQGHRFDIVEGFGCVPSTETSAVSFAFIWVAPMIPCMVTGFYGVLTLRYLKFYNRVTPARQTTWEKLNSDLIFTKSPYGIYRIIRMGTVVFLISLWTVLTPIFPLIIFAKSNSFTGFVKPSLSRIDIFASYASAAKESPEAQSMQLFLWSIPVYSVLFFIGNIDLDVIDSFRYMWTKHILRRSNMHPDPSPGIDLSSLTPVPVRRRHHRRIIRKSRMYDAPVTDEEFDFPFSTSSSSKFLESELKSDVRLPPTPEEALVLAKSYVEAAEAGYQNYSRPFRPAPQGPVPEDIVIDTTTTTTAAQTTTFQNSGFKFGVSDQLLQKYGVPQQQLQQPPVVFQFHEHREYKRQLIRSGGNTSMVTPRTRKREARRAMREHVQARDKGYPMHDIPESPRSFQGSMRPLSPELGVAGRVEIRSPIKSMYAEVVVNGIVVSGPFDSEFQYRGSEAV